jgi:methyltransferase (TIGR00027 family)
VLRKVASVVDYSTMLAMKESIPSRTALGVALRRAAHQILDNPRVLEDPLAVPIIGEAALDIRRQAARHQSPTGKHFRAFMVARSRYAEDQLASSIDHGVHQYVVLGAGLDTSAYRGVVPACIRVFEIDHPATQAWKIECLQAAAIPIPSFVRHVPVDFESQNLASELLAAGFRSDQPSLVSWLGVVPYLTREAAAHTFGFIGQFPKGSGVVFDYAVSRSSLGILERLALDELSRRVARAGEPFRLFFDPVDLGDLLKTSGFHRMEQLAAKEINEKYFSGRTDGLRVVGNAGRIVSAWT